MEEPNSETPSATQVGQGRAAQPKERPEPRAERARESRPFLVLLAAGLTVASFFGFISKSGIWDPHELTVADLSRRIALNLLGARSLELQGAVNTVPTLSELGRGQLPFTSVALGFKLFGLHEWAGRLPLAVWGLLGVIVCALAVARLADRASAAFTAIVLATMPLYFLHARTLLGDIVTMAALGSASAGLCVACFDRPRPGEARAKVARQRVLWLLVGLLGMGAGFGARGALIGVAVPALGVGFGWLVTRRRANADRLADVAGALSVALGVAAAGFGAVALLALNRDPNGFSLLVGAAAKRSASLPTFDVVVQYLGHGLFPWSALVPFALGRALSVPPQADVAELDRQAGLRVSSFAVASLAFAAYGFMAPVTGPLPFAGVCALAVLVALAMRDFEQGAAGSRAMAMGVAAFAILLFYDFQNFPEKGLAGFVVDDARFPESFKLTGTKLLEYGTLLTCGLFLLSFMEHNDEASAPFRRDEYLAWPRALRSLWSGNLLFGLLVGEAALFGVAVLSFIGERHPQVQNLLGIAAPMRELAKWGFVVLPVVVIGLPAGALLARDVTRRVYAISPLSRGVGACLSVAGFGALLSFGYYPALAAQISPKEVYESYRKSSHSGEPLGLLGVSAGSASYYAGRDVPTFSNVASGFDWLTAGPERRWLVTRAEDLAQLNSLFRARARPPSNLPVLDARSSEILLIASSLAPGERNANPLNDWISSEAPKPPHPLDANFGNQLDNLGWGVTTPGGKVVDAVVPGKPYVFTIYYKVVSPITGSWETFIHIDGFQRRFNGDHKTLEGKYPFHLWRVGDYIADVYTFTLEPNFTAGTYNVFYGLFSGSRRLEVKRGRAQEDRLEAGTLRVR